MEVSQLLTAETIVIVIMAVLALIGVANTVLTFVEKVRNAKKPHDDRLAMVQAHEEKLNRDYKIIQELQEQNKLLIENDLAVIEHIIGGNHVDRLKDRRDRIQSYLIEKS